MINESFEPKLDAAASLSGKLVCFEIDIMGIIAEINIK